MDPILPSIEKMQPGDHYCGIYRTDGDHRRLVVDFVREGMRRRDKMLYLINVQTAAQLRSILQSAGIDVDALLASGQLAIQAAKDVYLCDGVFDPDKMIAVLKESTQKALDEGYDALRVTGEMTWALAGEPGSERLVEYEAKLNEFFSSHRCYAICQYDRRRFDSEMLLDVLHTHPKVLFGTRGFENERMYYVPADGFLSNNRQGEMLDRWLENLTERSAA